VTTPSAGPYAGLAHLGADLVSVVDVRRRVVLADIAGIPAPHGVLVVPALGRAYASATAAHQLVTLDAASYWVLAAPRLGSSPTGSPTTSPPASCLSPTSRARPRSSPTRPAGSASANSLCGDTGNVVVDPGGPGGGQVLVAVQSCDRSR